MRRSRKHEARPLPAVFDFAGACIDRYVASLPSILKRRANDNWQISHSYLDTIPIWALAVWDDYRRLKPLDSRPLGRAVLSLIAYQEEGRVFLRIHYTSRRVVKTRRFGRIRLFGRIMLALCLSGALVNEFFKSYNHDIPEVYGRIRAMHLDVTIFGTVGSLVEAFYVILHDIAELFTGRD